LIILNSKSLSHLKEIHSQQSKTYIQIISNISVSLKYRKINKTNSILIRANKRCKTNCAENSIFDKLTQNNNTKKWSEAFKDGEYGH